MVLSITTSIPITAKVGEDTAITLTGTDFTSPLTVKIKGSNIDDVDALNIVVVSATQIICLIPGEIPKGNYNIEVEETVSGDIATLSDGFVVAAAFPTSPYVSETFTNIVTRILQRLPEKYDKREGSTVYDIIAPTAMEIANIYIQLTQVLDFSFVNRTTGVYLDYKGQEFGLTRLPAIKATGTVTFNGVNGTQIPAGTLIGTTAPAGQSPIQFVTDDLGTISGGSVSIAVTASLAGLSGNVAINAINVMLTSISGITSIANAAATSGGADEETDDFYRARLLRKAREPSHGGNKSDYILWAREASPQVGKVGIDPLGSGNGTVDVYFLTRDNLVPDAALITIVQDYIAPLPTAQGGGKAPIGATVDVQAATLDTVDVAVTITALPGFTAADVKTAVDTAIKKFLNDLDIGVDVLYHALSSTIMSVVGVSTMSAYTVDAGVIDVVIAASAKATPGTITVS